MQKRLLIAVLVLTVVLLFIGVMPVHGESEIYDTAVRLHVIAASDSEEDQSLKLAVRDAVLAFCTPLLDGVKDTDRAVELLEENKAALTEAARKVILAAGRQDSVEVLLGREEYPTRNYDAFCFPAGEYISLRVVIGEGEGKNWWCCLFPPLCVDAAKASPSDAFISVGLTPSQYKIITESDRPVYKIRFKLLEIFSRRS